MHSQIMNVTPELARSWLELNTFNRKISRHTVDRYKADMISGAWTLNHQGIAFDDNGVLVDGQHRLAAISESGASIKMMVTWGASRVGIDELRARSPADVIKFGGLSDWLDSKAVACAKQMAVLCVDKKGVSTISTSGLVEFSEKNKDAIMFSERLFVSHKKGVSSAAARAVVATAYYHYPESDLKEFVSSLYSGVVESPDRSAAVRCREQILDNGFSGGHGARRVMAHRMMRAIQAFCQRQPLKKLVTPSSAPFLLPEEKQ